MDKSSKTSETNVLNILLLLPASLVIVVFVPIRTLTILFRTMVFLLQMALQKLLRL